MNCMILVFVLGFFCFAILCACASKRSIHSATLQHEHQGYALSIHELSALWSDTLRIFLPQDSQPMLPYGLPNGTNLLYDEPRNTSSSLHFTGSYTSSKPLFVVRNGSFMATTTATDTTIRLDSYTQQDTTATFNSVSHKSAEFHDVFNIHSLIVLGCFLVIILLIPSHRR